MIRQSVDILTGTTESNVDWRMLNMNAELIASSLTTTLGPGLHSALGPYWKFNVNSGDGVAPINHILKFETFGHPCPLRTPLRHEYRLRLVATRNNDRILKRGHLVMTCDLFKKDEAPHPLVGRSEFWLALTRPFAPPAERRISDVPAGLKFLKEREPTAHDLISRGIESYRCDANDKTLTRAAQSIVFHMDQSDQYRHINTVKYLDRALDLLSLQCHKTGGDVGRLRFREIAIYFRKPFVPGQVAEVDLDFVQHADRFHGAVRFYHTNADGNRSERVSMAMETRGPLADGASNI